MGASSFNEGDPSRAVWAVCGQETGEGLESSPLMPLLDGLEGKKQGCFWKWGSFDPKDEIFFC